MKESDYIELLKQFLTQADETNLKRIASNALNALKNMTLDEYLKDPLVCYNGGHERNLMHNDMCVERFSKLLPMAQNKYNKKAELINYYKQLRTSTKDEEADRVAALRRTKLQNLFKFHLLPYSDGKYYHWCIDVDNVYDRIDDHQLIPNISDALLRQDPCVVYAERSATCGLFALVAADPQKMDIEQQIIPVPNCCMGITKDAAQDAITQMRYLCGRDAQWQPHDVSFCDNYIKVEVKEDVKKNEETQVTQTQKNKGGLNTNILSDTVCNILHIGANIKDGIFQFSKDKNLFNNLERYNYKRCDLDLVPRQYGSGWDNVDFKEKSPKPRLKSRKKISCRYLNEAINKGEIKLERGKIYIIPTGCGKSYALKEMKNPRMVFLTTRIGLVDEFGENNNGQWKRLYTGTKIEDDKQYYGTAQGISETQIDQLKEYDYTFHIDEIHSWFEFADLADKLNYIMSPEPNIVGYTASATEHLQVWGSINEYELIDCAFDRKKQKLSLFLTKYYRVTRNILAITTRIIQGNMNEDKKIVVYLNDKEKIEQIAKSLPTGSVYTYYTTEQKDREARKDWESENKRNLTNFKRQGGGACLLCTSKLGLGANFHNVVDLFVVFSNSPDNIQQIIAREREKDVEMILFSKTFSSSYLEHEVGWQNILDSYYSGNKSKGINANKCKMFTKQTSNAITDLVKTVYEKYSEVFYNNLFYILKENWQVEDNSNPKSQIFPIVTINREILETDRVAGRTEMIHKGLMKYISLEKEKQAQNDTIPTSNWTDLLGDGFPVTNKSEKIRYIRPFIEKYKEFQKELQLPHILTLQDMGKKEVYEIIRRVKKRCRQENTNLWTVVKEVLKEKGYTEKFTKADIPTIEQEVKRRCPTFTNTLKSVLKDRYKFDWETKCYVRRSKKSNATIKRENTDKKLLEHLTDNKMEITSKSVKEAMEVLHIEGNPDSIAKRLKRKTKKVC